MQSENNIAATETAKPDRKYRRMFAKCNLAIVLADVADSLLMEFEAESLEHGRGLKQETKMRFNMMRQAGKAFKTRVKDVARDGYKISDSESFCDDSDYLKDILMLMIDRTGDNKDKMIRLRAMIYNMKSEMEIYQNS